MPKTSTEGPRTAIGHAYGSISVPPRFEATTAGIVVAVQPVYLAEQSEPEDSRYVWAYRVEIVNDSGRTVQLQERSWEITDATGRVEHVRGPGVVGEKPVMRPGDRFEYTSGCPLSTSSGFMRGHYTFDDDGQESFQVEIPAFSLDTPDDDRVLN